MVKTHEMPDLRRMRFLINRLPMAKLKVERAMSEAAQCTQSLSAMPRGVPRGDKVADGAIRYAEAKESRDRILDELTTLRSALVPHIDALQGPLERTTMRMRYMDGLSARDIAYRLCYSEQHIFRVLKRAEAKVTSEVHNNGLAKDE